MTDREKLIELCEDLDTLPCCDTYEGQADYLIANGVTVTDNNVGCKWIPVTERLPTPKHQFDARNWYLVALSNGVVKELAYEFHEHSVFGYGWRETAYPVTHWMPLPTAPEDVK
jgi:hypothetical protein